MFLCPRVCGIVWIWYHHIIIIYKINGLEKLKDKKVKYFLFHHVYLLHWRILISMRNKVSCWQWSSNFFFFLKNCVYGICIENAIDTTDCCSMLAMHVALQVCYTCILLSWQFPAGSCPPPVTCLCLVPRNEAVTMIKLFRMFLYKLSVRRTGYYKLDFSLDSLRPYL